MKKNYVLLSAATILMVLGIYMIYLGTKANIVPPTVTGIGFIVIAMAFLGLRQK